MLPGDGHFSLGIFGQIGNLRQRPWAVDAKRAKAAIFRWASSVKLAIFGRDRGPSMRTSEGGRFSLGIFGQVGNLRQRPWAIDANERRRPFFVGHLRSSWQSSAKTAGHRCERAKTATFRGESSVKLATFGLLEFIGKSGYNGTQPTPPARGPRLSCLSVRAGRSTQSMSLLMRLSPYLLSLLLLANQGLQAGEPAANPALAEAFA